MIDEEMLPYIGIGAGLVLVAIGLVVSLDKKPKPPEAPPHYAVLPMGAEVPADHRIYYVRDEENQVCFGAIRGVDTNVAIANVNWANCPKAGK